MRAARRAMLKSNLSTAFREPGVCQLAEIIKQPDTHSFGWYSTNVSWRLNACKTFQNGHVFLLLLTIVSHTPRFWQTQNEMHSKLFRIVSKIPMKWFHQSWKWIKKFLSKSSPVVEDSRRKWRRAICYHGLKGVCTVGRVSAAVQFAILSVAISNTHTHTHTHTFPLLHLDTWTHHMHIPCAVQSWSKANLLRTCKCTDCLNLDWQHSSKVQGKVVEEKNGWKRCDENVFI